MEKDRDQLTPDEPEDWAKLQGARGQGTGATGYDRLPGEEAPAEFHDVDAAAEVLPDPLPES
ncbi:MAG TPA: hypothetical protein VHT97_10480 [Acidimicrobiales bacterium]|jgi:hypothetical protein|nr:hypothetical protein [Acidimicrobiales bacterium]